VPGCPATSTTQPERRYTGSLSDVTAGQNIRIKTRSGKHLSGQVVSARDSLVLAVDSGISVSECTIAFTDVAKAEVYKSAGAGQAVFATFFIAIGALPVLATLFPPFEGW
jgi:hypothetical protein